jgi:hypothetical protein
MDGMGAVARGNFELLATTQCDNQIGVLARLFIITSTG